MSHPGKFESNFLNEVLFEQHKLDRTTKLFVAFSGGLDSTVLLHALLNDQIQSWAEIVALHVNHGLNEQAGEWELHCRDLCRRWGIRFKSTRLHLPAQSQHGLEAAAREARYQWFESELSIGSVVLTAHHLEDQAETVMGNLFRGSGVHGAAGISPFRTLGPGTLIRPLLGVSRTLLRQYALEHELHWVEDPMNADFAYTRNYIRHKLMPAIEERWPNAAGAIVRASEHWRESRQLLDEIADDDLSRIAKRTVAPYYLLSVTDLLQLRPLRQTNLLRFWIRQNNFNTPSKAQLDRVMDELIEVRPSVTHIVAWPGVQLRRYRNWLYLSCAVEHIHPDDVVWKPDEAGAMSMGSWRLVTSKIRGDGISSRVCEKNRLEIRTRRGGETCLLPGRRTHSKVKKLMQAAGIPPWLRNQHPLIFVNDSVAGVVGLCYCSPYAATREETGVTFTMRVPESA